MEPTQINYQQIDAFVQHGRNLRSRAIREFFGALFSLGRPTAAVKAQTQGC